VSHAAGTGSEPELSSRVVNIPPLPWAKGSFLRPVLVSFLPCDATRRVSPFAERHFQRLSRLLQASMFIDFMWQNMRLADASRQEETPL